MQDLTSLKGSLGIGNTLTEADKKKKQADTEAYLAREKERERNYAVYVWAQRLATALKFSPPERFGPCFDGLEGDKPLMEYGATFESFNSQLQPKAFQAAKDFAQCTENDDQDNLLVPGLLLVGPVGVGKSHLAAAIYNYEFQQWLGSTKPFHPRFTTETDLLASVRASFQQEAKESEHEVIKGWSSCHTLILDDLCKYEAADPRFRNRILFEVIDKLWGGCSQLVATSNYPIPELTQMLGEPIADRLRDMCVVVEMKGASQRGKRGRASV